MTTSSVAVRSAGSAWSFVTCIAFRFAFCYFVLSCIDLASGAVLMLRFAIGMRGSEDTLLDPLWHQLVPWVGANVLHLGRIDLPGGVRTSGDTKYDYVVLFCRLLLSVLVTVVWSILDRKRTAYRVLNEWLRYAVSLTLALLLFAYGSIKVFPLQFGTPSLRDLSHPVGSLSPEEMLWAFMSASKGYTVFTGAVELVAGVLLLLPRCTALGALVALGAIGNVFALNLAYDVPVKLNSFHMLLLAVFLVLPELQRLTRFFVLNRDVASMQSPSLTSHRWVNRTALTARALAGAAFLTTFLWFAHRDYRAVQSFAAIGGPLKGIWVADQFRVIDDPSRPLLTPKLARSLGVAPGDDRWQQLVFGSPGSVAIQLSDGTFDDADLSLDDKAGVAKVTDRSDPSWVCNLLLHRKSDSVLAIEGTVNGTSIEARLHRVNKSMPLTTTRFHWVHEH